VEDAKGLNKFSAVAILAERPQAEIEQRAPALISYGEFISGTHNRPPNLRCPGH
jgi:hypothetical protein